MFSSDNRKALRLWKIYKKTISSSLDRLFERNYHTQFWQCQPQHYHVDFTCFYIANKTQEMMVICRLILDKTYQKMLYFSVNCQKLICISFDVKCVYLYIKWSLGSSTWYQCNTYHIWPSLNLYHKRRRLIFQYSRNCAILLDESNFRPRPAKKFSHQLLQFFHL